MNILRTVITASALVLSTSVNAALIDNGIYSTDDVSGLEWLDLNITRNVSYSSSLSSNPGWRHATNTEVENLFSVAFDGYYSNNTIDDRSDSNNGIVYSDQASDVSNFNSLFGTTYSNTANLWSFGMYMDENNILRAMGAAMEPSGEGYTSVLGMDFSADLSSSIETGHTNLGFYMVRTTVVPVPAAAWLFGSGLIGLVGFARRKGNS